LYKSFWKFHGSSPHGYGFGYDHGSIWKPIPLLSHNSSNRYLLGKVRTKNTFKGRKVQILKFNFIINWLVIHGLFPFRSCYVSSAVELGFLKITKILAIRWNWLDIMTKLSQIFIGYTIKIVHLSDNWFWKILTLAYIYRNAKENYCNIL